MASGDTQTFQASKPISILREQVKLVLEVCHFTEDLNPLWPARKSFSQLQTLSQPIKEKVQGLQDQQEVFEQVRQYFFEVLEFQVIESKQLSFRRCLLPTVLEDRRGPHDLVMLLFSTLLEEAGIKSQIASCRKRHLLKVQLNGRAHIADLDQQCEFLDHQEILDLVNSGFDFSIGPLNAECLVVEYFNNLKRLTRDENRLHVLSMVHSYLMRYQPFNLKHLSERAMVAFETGDYKTAVDDIRSYFQYKQPQFTNDRLKQIYKIALKRERSL